jgi:S-DNA-T family DNA segregation ATPase FtsK/SpoIIIE
MGNAVSHCDDCGFVYTDVSPAEIPAALSEFGPQFSARLARDPAALRSRPSPEVWSPLEYTCHLRDVLVVQRERLALALVEDCPTFVPMGRDERVTRDRYNDQDPQGVADELTVAATAIAEAFAALSADQWERSSIYNYPTRTERTMVWLGQHTIHEGRHHLADVDAGLAGFDSLA